MNPDLLRLLNFISSSLGNYLVTQMATIIVPAIIAVAWALSGPRGLINCSIGRMGLMGPMGPWGPWGLWGPWGAWGPWGPSGRAAGGWRAAIGQADGRRWTTGGGRTGGTPEHESEQSCCPNGVNVK